MAKSRHGRTKQQEQAVAELNAQLDEQDVVTFTGYKQWQSFSPNGKNKAVIDFTGCIRWQGLTYKGRHKKVIIPTFKAITNITRFTAVTWKEQVVAVPKGQRKFSSMDWPVEEQVAAEPNDHRTLRCLDWPKIEH